MTHIEALKLARYALTGDGWRKTGDAIRAIDEALTEHPAPVPPPWWPAVENILNEYGLQAIDFVADFKEALAQPQPHYLEIPGMRIDHVTGNVGIGSLPAQRTWVGLSDEEAIECWPGLAMYADCAKFWENIEAKLKAKNDN